MAEITLKGGATTRDPRLDRVREFDERSRSFPVGEIVPERVASKTWRLPRSYYGDQGQEGACVEFGITHELACQPVVIPVRTLATIRSEHRIYWPAQEGDPWPGGSYPGATPRYEGTSVLSGIKVAQGLGFFESYRWAFSIDEAVRGVVHEGPAVIALDWTEGLAYPAPNGLARDSGGILGGHCVAWIGVQFGMRFAGEGRLDVAVIAQSWGLEHGDRGRVYVPLDDLERRLDDAGEVCFPIGRRKP